VCPIRSHSSGSLTTESRHEELGKHLAPQRIRELHLAYNENPDPRLLDTLVRHYLPLAERMCHRYRHNQEPLDDLIQVASLALVKALKNFDPTLGFPFEAYAIPTIRGQLKRHFRDSTWAVRVPRRAQETMLRLGEGIDRLSTRLGRSPTIGELAGFLKVDEEEVLEALQVQRVYEAASLDAPASNGGHDETRSLMDVLGQDEAGFALAEERGLLESALAELTPRERMLLHLRFVEDLTQSEIGRHLGCSQMQVSRLLRQVVAHLRELLVDEPAATTG
jgi:RNA polymerase sigma-B factor